MKTQRTSRALLAAMALSSSSLALADTSQQLLEQKIDNMAQELQLLKSQLQELKAQNTTLVNQQAEQKQQVAQQQTQLQAVQDTQTQIAAKPSALANLDIWGYGELYYNHPTKHSDKTQADLARAVFGFGYQFNDRTRFNSEFEIEHAVTSSSDVGEFEVEQFYVDHKLTDWASLQAGLFLIPSGLLNESHEPTHYYGVQRNFVETLIIPSTWREGGLALHGNTDNGFNWNAGLTTGLDLSKWNFTPQKAPYTTALELQTSAIAPMQATHQEMAFANAQHLSQYVSVNYSGIPSLLIGGSIFTGGVVRNQTNIPDNERVLLWEAHGRWNPGKWDISALYAHGSFSHTADANAQFPGSPNPLPAEFYGYYLQAAYNAWQNGDYRLSPFVRAEHYDMGAKYEGIPAGTSTTPAQPLPGLDFLPQTHDTVYTIGANFYLNPNVVLKADYQNFRINKDFSRFDLGLGVEF
ncbi:cell division protein ZapB [Andreprevotia chitinilytica]|uniref:cell division protein ZapB n=1 Tax=Andreprevotia chitinilytica TaxID=396808 RepID=UPI00054F9D6C|nr:porin [Andreprevotia chitinilytica]